MSQENESKKLKSERKASNTKQEYLNQSFNRNLLNGFMEIQYKRCRMSQVDWSNL